MQEAVGVGVVGSLKGLLRQPRDSSAVFSQLFLLRPARPSGTVSETGKVEVQIQKGRARPGAGAKERKEMTIMAMPKLKLLRFDLPEDKT